MNNNNQIERVPDEELDQMIWKLERDGMTPKMLSLMRELREVRRAVKPTDDERIMAIEGISPQFKPVADLYGITSPTGSETSFTFDAIEAANFIEGGWTVQEYVELERYQEAMIGNPLVTPDGWIPVSERVPPEGTPMLVCSGNGVVQRTVYGFDGENWLDWYEQYDLVKTEPDDLWQPLPESPRQE